MAAKHAETLREIASSFSAAYVKTPTKLKILDAFSICALVTAVLQVRRERTASRLSPTGALCASQAA